jgi:outer membrane lipoprotein-sorting protein
MDAAAAKFRSAQADLTSDQYEKVVNETDTQGGKAYFRRKNGEMEMALDITQPDKKYVLVRDDKAQLYQPNIDQVTEYDINRSNQDVEGMFALGFGGRGHDLLKSFEVKLGGSETIGGVPTQELLLSAKSPKVRNMFSLITLWVDPTRGVSLQQRFDEPSGDYRLAKYTNIKLNEKISDDVFKLNTTSATKVVKPQG